jgi:hypothetical protein
VESIRPVTAGWGEERVGAGRAEAGVYVLAERLDPLTLFEVGYGGVVSDGWRVVVPQLNAERARLDAGGERDRP